MNALSRASRMIFFAALVATMFPGGPSLLPTVRAGESTAMFDEEGFLLLPEGYRTWVYVGGSVTPNEMNHGQAAFPEFHNTYMDPRSFQEYRRTGKFPEGTILVKEPVGVGSKKAPSGNGYFMGDFVGVYAEVKDSQRFPDEPGHWAFFSFTAAPGEAPKKKAEPLPTAACNSCHQAGAEEYVFSQYYPILKAAKPK